jgi:hypothetical protein
MWLNALVQMIKVLARKRFSLLIVERARAKLAIGSHLFID